TRAPSPAHSSAYGSRDRTMISKEKPIAELFVEPQSSGVVQVRRSIIVLAAALLILLVFVLVWCVARQPTSSPRALGPEYRPADVALLDREYTRRSDAVATKANRGAVHQKPNHLNPCILSPQTQPCGTTIDGAQSNESRGATGPKAPFTGKASVAAVRQP